MTYVRANTAPIFGARFQSINPANTRLGVYMRASFPLPTTSLSRPLRLGDPGPFWDGPYPSYGIQEYSRTRALGGEWVPPGQPDHWQLSQGAVTYRINPQTGRYEFHTTDIVPRGVWQQNVFQHPAKPALSSLGVPMRSRGVSLVSIGGRPVIIPTTPLRQGPRSQDPFVKLRAAFSGALGRLSGDCGCGCGGCCTRMSGLGDDCTFDSDCGPNGVCGAGQCFTQAPAAPAPPAAGNAAGCTYDSNGNLVPGSPAVCAPKGTTSSVGQQLTSVIQSIDNAIAPPPTVVPAPSSGGFFGGSTNIGGLSIPNPVLIGGVALIAASLMGGRRR